jgi:hypothetical protein
MISLIISTHRLNLLDGLKKSVDETIGVEYEIILIENNGEMGICKAYNIGAQKASFPYLCFVHDDVVFKTINWGNILIEKFKMDNSTGLIGVAGSKYKSLSPGRGWFTGRSDVDRYHIIQGNNKLNTSKIDTSGMIEDFVEVVCLDGVFLFTTKNTWGNNRFDEATFNNFHCYDLDFSLTVSKSLKLFVTNQLLLQHASKGDLNEQWLRDTITFSKKWKSNLPIGSLNKRLQKDIEWDQKIWFLLEMKKYGFSLLQVLRVFLSLGFVRFFSFNKSVKTLKLLLHLYFKNA